VLGWEAGSRAERIVRELEHFTSSHAGERFGAKRQYKRFAANPPICVYLRNLRRRLLYSKQS
jgi:hypothetical protein